MSRHDQDTTLGGAKGSFETTPWPQIQKAKTGDQERRRASVDNLVSRYWKPVYCYLRRKGYTNEKAKDLTQDFFCEIVLERKLIQQADQDKGRFRTFLLTALDHYVASIHRKETAKKHLYEYGSAQLDPAELPDLPIAESNVTLELAFHYWWVTNLLDQVLPEVKDEYCSTGRVTYWEVFQARIIGPILDNAYAPSLAELCSKYGIENEKRASNMVITVKRRFSTALRHHLQRFGHSDSEIEREIYELIEILSKGGAA